MEISKCLLCYRRKKKKKKKKKEIVRYSSANSRRSGIPPDIHYDMLACFENKGFPWREVALWEVFQNLSSELQGELLLSVRWSMSVAPAGIMYYPTMHSKLVKVVNTITFATYKTFFFWSWLTLCTIIPQSELIHRQVSLTWTKFNVQNSGLVVFRTNDLALGKKYVTKILWLKKLICSWML